MGDLVKKLKIKTQTCVRLNKELAYYLKEKKDHEIKVEEMTKKSSDPYDIKKKKELVEESAAVIKDTTQRLVKAYEDLYKYYIDNKGSLVEADNEQAELARATLLNVASQLGGIKQLKTEGLQKASSASSGDENRIKQIIRDALEEDLSTAGDVTTLSTIDEKTMATARFLAKANGVLAGLHVAELVFAEVDPDIEVKWQKKDGDVVKEKTVFGTAHGPAHSLIVAERLALNLMQRMSGIATATRKMVDAVKGTKTKILDTRKTVPGLRVLDKLAVHIGGGVNHRFGLFDMIMIKDNHVTAAGGITKAVKRAQDYLKKHKDLKNIEIEVETRTLEEVKEAVALRGIHRIMLDNMVTIHQDGEVDTSRLEEAVAIVKGRVPTEASGNVTMHTVRAIAMTGVDYISSGILTHSVTALDISMKIKLDEESE